MLAKEQRRSSSASTVTMVTLFVPGAYPAGHLPMPTAICSSWEILMSEMVTVPTVSPAGIVTESKPAAYLSADADPEKIRPMRMSDAAGSLTFTAISTLPPP